MTTIRIYVCVHSFVYIYEYLQEFKRVVFVTGAVLNGARLHTHKNTEIFGCAGAGKSVTGRFRSTLRKVP